MSNRAPKASKSRKTPKMAPKTRRQSPLLALVLGAATLVGGVAALLTLLPRVSLAVSDPTDPDDPFSSSVTITNTGYIPLHSVVADIAWNKIMFLDEKGNRKTLLGDMSIQHFRSTHWGFHYLGLDDRFTISLNDVFAANKQTLIESEIAVVVEYDLPIIHLRREKRFPFFAKRQRKGTFYWYAETMPRAN